MSACGSVFSDVGLGSWEGQLPLCSNKNAKRSITLDFTFEKYIRLLKTLKRQGYGFITFEEYLTQPQPARFIILRHDVERKYERALKFAGIQHELGIRGTYYFRVLPRCFRPEIIKKIAACGHETGYHYDDLTQCKGDHERAIARFEKNLQTIRAIAPVKTICMDGSPLSGYDNRDLWNGKAMSDELVSSNSFHSPLITHSSSPPTQYSFKTYGLLGEPYFNLNFDEVFYLTDTGRRWDGWKVSVRDKVPQQQQWIKQGLVFHSTEDIINAATKGQLPDNIMFTFHPQRWNDRFLPWMKELVLQRVKNVVKRGLLKTRSFER
jgi:hypothetical protein